MALIVTTSSCGGLPPDADPLASMAQAVDEDERYPPPLSESWRRTLDEPLAFRPAVGANNVYLAIGSRVVAWRVRDGETTWGPIELESDVSAAPLVVDQQVVIATRGGDATEPRVWWFSSGGSLISQTSVASSISEITAVPGIVIYMDSRGIGRLGGSNEWHTVVDGAATLQLAAEQEVALVTTDAGSLAAYNLNDGNVRWRYRADVGITRAHVHDGRAFVGTADGRVIAFRVADGRVDWRRTLGTSVVGSPAQTDELLWIAGLDARLNAVNAGNGTQMYAIDLSSRNYLDIVTFDRWAVVGARYGPWVAVRAPTRVEQSRAGLRQPAPPVQVRAQGPPGSEQPDLSVPAGSGPAGVAVVNGDGTIVFLELQRTRPRSSW